jgi:hypothetical protein
LRRRSQSTAFDMGISRYKWIRGSAQAGDVNGCAPTGRYSPNYRFEAKPNLGAFFFLDDVKKTGTFPGGIYSARSVK